MQHEQSSSPTPSVPSITQVSRSVFPRRGIIIAIAVGAFIAGTIIGNGGVAQASDEPSIEKADVVVKERVAPPVITIPKGGVAIIGASDDRYYIVQQDGTLAILTGLNKEDLCWRRADER